MFSAHMYMHRACFSVHEYRRSKGKLAVSILCSVYGSANMGKWESAFDQKSGHLILGRVWCKLLLQYVSNFSVLGAG